MKKRAKSMYNTEIKEKFINEKYNNISTIKGVKDTFLQVALKEEEYQKDVADFSIDELKNLFYFFECSTVKSLDQHRSKINMYRLWANDKGYFKFNVAYDSVLREDLHQYINKIKHDNAYFKSIDEFYSFVDKIYNPVDQALVVLLYEGVWGSREKENFYEELRNLRFEDCNFDDNTLRLTKNDGSQRVIQIPEKSMNYIFEAIYGKDNSSYYEGNGTSRGRDPVKELADTHFVLRGNAGRERLMDYTGGKISSFVISQRIIKISKWTDCTFITPTTILWSGMLNKCKKIEDTKGEIAVKDFIDMVVSYDMNPSNYYQLMEKYKLVYETK